MLPKQISYFYFHNLFQYNFFKSLRILYSTNPSVNTKQQLEIVRLPYLNHLFHGCHYWWPVFSHFSRGKQIQVVVILSLGTLITDFEHQEPLTITLTKCRLCFLLHIALTQIAKYVQMFIYKKKSSMKIIMYVYLFCTFKSKLCMWDRVWFPKGACVGWHSELVTNFPDSLKVEG